MSERSQENRPMRSSASVRPVPMMVHVSMVMSESVKGHQRDRTMLRRRGQRSAGAGSGGVW